MHKNKRNKKGILVSLIGIILNFILGLIKVFLSFKTHSISILADALNNLTDMTSSFLTIIGFKLGNKKPTKTHPYGYARYEYISAFTISLFMIMMSITFVIKSINKIINPEDLIINNITFIILTITLILKVIQMILYKRMSNKLNSASLKATSIETRNDVITNASILISMVIMKNYSINIDGYIGLIVSLIILFSSLKTCKDTLELLVGKIPEEEKIKNIKNKILSYNNIESIHNLMIHNYGVGIDYITVHIEVNSKIDIMTIHELSNKIEKDFKKNNMNITIHIDPIIYNKKINNLKNKINKRIKRIDESLLINDFRIKNNKILFNLIIPHDKEYNIDFIKENLLNEYNYEINIERPYC